MTCKLCSLCLFSITYDCCIGWIVFVFLTCNCLRPRFFRFMATSNFSKHVVLSPKAALVGDMLFFYFLLLLFNRFAHTARPCYLAVVSGCLDDRQRQRDRQTDRLKIDPQIDPKSTPKSTPNRPNIDPNRPQLDQVGLLRPQEEQEN